MPTFIRHLEIICILV